MTWKPKKAEQFITVHSTRKQPTLEIMVIYQNFITSTWKKIQVSVLLRVFQQHHLHMWETTFYCHMKRFFSRANADIFHDILFSPKVSKLPNSSKDSYLCLFIFKGTVLALEKQYTTHRSQPYKKWLQFKKKSAPY